MITLGVNEELRLEAEHATILTECFVQNSGVSYLNEWTTDSCVGSSHTSPQLLTQYHCNNILSIKHSTLHKLVVMGTKHRHTLQFYNKRIMGMSTIYNEHDICCSILQ